MRSSILHFALTFLFALGWNVSFAHTPLAPEVIQD